MLFARSNNLHMHNTLYKKLNGSNRGTNSFLGLEYYFLFI